MIRALRSFFLLLVLVAAGGCTSAGKSKVDGGNNARLGRVPIQFQYTSADLPVGGYTFNVYRAADFTGPFERINTEPITPAPDARVGTIQLLMVDNQVLIDRDYYYYLERVDADGSRRKVSPVVEATALVPDGMSRDSDKPQTRPSSRQSSEVGTRERTTDRT